VFTDQPAPQSNTGFGLTWDIIESTIKTIQARIEQEPVIYYGVSDAVPPQDLGRRPIFFVVSARPDGVMDLIVMHSDNWAQFESEAKRLGIVIKPAAERPVERPDPSKIDMVRLAQGDAQELFRRGMGRMHGPPVAPEE